MSRLLFAAMVAATMAGCKRSDSEKLAAVARTVSGNVQALLPDKTPLKISTAGPNSLEQRVLDRFRSDYYLTDAPILIRATGTTVQLSGQVADPAVKRRAVELAASTVGVETVTDEIVVAP